MGDVRQDITEEQAEWRIRNDEPTFAEVYGKRVRIVEMGPPPKRTGEMRLVTAWHGGKFHTPRFFAHNFGKEDARIG